MTSTGRTTGADLLAEALATYGVPYVFGNPGTTELPIIDAVTERDECEYMMALHEDIAVGMAAGFAKTRAYHAHNDESVLPVGVANLHAAPGLAHGLGNVHGASFAGAPLVVTAGIQSRGFQHEEPILSGDLVEMTQQFTKWSASVDDVDALPTMLRRAFRTALTPPTAPVFLGFPLDVIQSETDAEVEPLGEIPTAGRGDDVQIKRAADLLSEASNPVMVVGDGVARAGRDAIDAAVRLADAGGMRVHGEILAAEVSFPTDHDLWHSFIPPSEEVARRHMDTDTLLFVGCSTNTTITAYDEPLVPSDTTCIHVSDDPWQVGKNQPADAAVVGDPAAVLDELATELDDRIDEGTRRQRLDRIHEYRTGSEEDETISAGDDPIASKPEFVDRLESAAPDALVVDESITTKYVFLDRFSLSAEQFLSTKGGGLGYGLPAAIGAAIAEGLIDSPRDVVGLIGDGSFLYYPHALYSAARYDVDIAIVIPDNRSYTVLKDNTIEMLRKSSDEYDFESMGIEMTPSVNIPAMAHSQNVDGCIVRDRDDITSAIEAAADESGPTVVDVLIRD